MSNANFFALMYRRKYINRWGLMRNSRRENISEHSLDTAMISYALCVLRNERFAGNVNAERAALLALFHDAAEIITGDLPTPVKYFNSDISGAYKDVESVASEKLLSMLPDDMKKSYKDLLIENEDDKELWKIVRAADKISALLKCVEEENAGNGEFSVAKKSTLEAIKKLSVKEADVFIEEFLPSYTLSLDELIY